MQIASRSPQIGVILHAEEETVGVDYDAEPFLYFQTIGQNERPELFFQTFRIPTATVQIVCLASAPLTKAHGSIMERSIMEANAFVNSLGEDNLLPYKH